MKNYKVEIVSSYLVNELFIYRYTTDESFFRCLALAFVRHGLSVLTNLNPNWHFTCSRLTTETPEKGVKYVQS